MSDEAVRGDTDDSKALRLAGWLLIAGLATFVALIGLSGGWRALPRGGGLMQAQNLPDIAADITDRMRVYRIYLVASIPTLLGTVALARTLAARRSAFLATSAAVLFATGTVLWMVALTFHLDVSTRVARLHAMASPTGISQDAWRTLLTELYSPFFYWAQSLYDAHMILSFVAATGFGLALFRTRIVRAWISILLMAFGVFWGYAFVIQLPDFPGRAWDLSDTPLWIHAWGAAVGTALLWGRPRVAEPTGTWSSPKP